MSISGNIRPCILSIIVMPLIASLLGLSIMSVTLSTEPAFTLGGSGGGLGTGALTLRNASRLTGGLTEGTGGCATSFGCTVCGGWGRCGGGTFAVCRLGKECRYRWW